MHTALGPPSTWRLAGRRDRDGRVSRQVIPELAPIVKQLKVFSGHPSGASPSSTRRCPVRRGWRQVPGGKTVQRMLSQAFVEFTFPLAANYFTLNPFARNMDEAGRAYPRAGPRSEVRGKLTPWYAAASPGFHNTYLSTFNRDNVGLITEPIARVTESGVTTADGHAHDVDALILATGFDDGRRGGDLHHHQVTARSLAFGSGRTTGCRPTEGQHPGIPQPVHGVQCTGMSGSSYFALIEAQTRHIVRCLSRRAHQGAAVEVSATANDRYIAEMMRAAPADFLAAHVQGRQQLLLRQQRGRADPADHHRRGVLAQPQLPAEGLPVQRLTPYAASRRKTTRDTPHCRVFCVCWAGKPGELDGGLRSSTLSSRSPRQVHVGAAEVAAGRRGRINRPQQVRVPHDGTGRRSKTALMAFSMRCGSTVSVPNVSTNRPTGAALPMA